MAFLKTGFWKKNGSQKAEFFSFASSDTQLAGEKNCRMLVLTGRLQL